MNPVDFLNKYFQFKIGSINFAPTYWQAGAIVFLIFLLVITLAQVHRHLMDYSLKGGIIGIVLGFFLALILEGFLLLGGKTVLINVLGWKNPPKPLSNALDLGRDKLVGVLGTQSQEETSKNQSFNTDQFLITYSSLSTSDTDRIQKAICTN